MFPPAVVLYIILGAARIYYSPESGFANITSSLWGFFYIFDLIMIAIIFYLYFSKWGKEWKSFIVFVMPFVTIILVISIPFIDSSRRVSLTSESGVIINHILAAHIFFTIIGELFFFLSFMGSILYLTMERQLRKKTSMKFIFRLPALDSVEKFNRWAISRSFFFLTAGIIVGLTMSFLVYGTVFLGTPKEVHIFFSWAIILGIYFIRRLKKLVSHKINIINIAMFIIIMFLFIFTNIYITKGFHGFK
jgi:ABC-type transport system involved in cytochrome c biogenesis permease subunit